MEIVVILAQVKVLSQNLSLRSKKTSVRTSTLWRRHGVNYTTLNGL